MKWVATLDPRTLLLVVTLALTLSLFYSGDTITDAAFCSLFSGLLLAISRYKLVIIGALVLVVVQGAALWLSGLLPIHAVHMVFLLASLARKLFLIAAAGVFLLDSISVGDCIRCLEKTKVPWSVIVPFAICFRFLPTITHECRMIRDALRLRGLYSTAYVLRHPFATLELFGATLLFRIMAISGELTYSVSTRAATGSRSAWYTEKTFSLADLAFTIFVVGSVAAIIVFLHYGRSA